MIVAVSVLCTLGEPVYTGSITAFVAAAAPSNVLGRALGRLQFSTGLGLTLSPAVMTALAAHGPAALWLPLAADPRGEDENSSVLTAAEGVGHVDQGDTAPRHGDRADAAVTGAGHDPGDRDARDQ